MELAPTSAVTHLALANFLWTTGKLTEAEAAFLEGHRLEPGNPLANRALATVYISSSRAAEAEPFLRALAEREPADRLALADYYVMLRRYDDALKNLEPITTAASIGGDARTRLAAVKFLKGNREEAMRDIDALLAEGRAPTAALLTKAKFLMTESKPQEALPLAERASLGDPRDINAH